MAIHYIIALIRKNFVTHIILAYIYLSSGLIVNVLQILTLPLWYLGYRKTYRWIIGRLNYLTWGRK